ncbi:hypothetical protein IGI04_015232 [Brassica rapa subsp. trilocularis]|uniref:Uncharacterized protein n=1 Tax=Brassica rapa subsp. trilocularis TaxID=1813537 RepID=A0ABQ7MQ11_BRACM|nr:hypothetical protein IGI04_015232 [Brassica rapa subsp. trilocularis]
MAFHSIKSLHKLTRITSAAGSSVCSHGEEPDNQTKYKAPSHHKFENNLLKDKFRNRLCFCSLAHVHSVLLFLTHVHIVLKLKTGIISTSAEEETWSSLLEFMEAIDDRPPPTLLPSESFSFCKRTQSKLCKGSNGLLKSPSLKIISGTSFLEEVRRQLWDKSGIILQRCMVSVCNA